MKPIFAVALVLLVTGCTSQLPDTTTTTVLEDTQLQQIADQITSDLGVEPLVASFSNPAELGAPEFVDSLYSADYSYIRNNESINLNFVLMSCTDKCLDEYYELILADEETYKEQFSTLNFTVKIAVINGKEVLENIRVIESVTLCPPDELTCAVNVYFFFWQHENVIIQARSIANTDMEETYIEVLGEISIA